MKSFTFIINIIILLILLFLIFKGQSENTAYDNSFLIMFIIVISVLCVCSYKTIENLDNVENEEIYDYSKATTKNLKVVKKIDGLENQIKSLIPIGYVYLTTKKEFDPNTVFGGTWKRLNPDSGNTNKNMFLMTAFSFDDKDVDFAKENKINCAFTKEVGSSQCPEQGTYDVITDIGTVTGSEKQKLRSYGGLNKIRLNIDNVPPHNHYLRGDKTETLVGDGTNCPSSNPKCSNCYNRVKFGFYIDQQKAVGGWPKSGGVDKDNLRRIRTNAEDDNDAYWTLTTQQINDNFNNDSFKDPYSKQTQVEEHSNVPPYIMIYGWRKTGN